MGLGNRPKPQPPQPQPPPTSIPVHITCWGPSGLVVPTRMVLQLDDATTYVGVNTESQVHFTLPPSTVYGWQATVWVEGDPRFEASMQRITLAPDINITLTAVVRKLPDLFIRGQFLQTANAYLTWIEKTSFMFHARLLNEGANVAKDVARELGKNGLGFNAARIFLMNESVGHINPNDDGFWSALPECVGILANEGIYPSFVAGTQWGSLMPDPSAQVAYLDRLFIALHDVPCVISKQNEANHDGESRISDTALKFMVKPQGAKFLLSNGSNVAGNQTVTPVGDVGEYHSNDLDTWQRKVGHNAMEENADVFRIPVWASENTRSDNDHYNLVHAYDAARNGALLCMGSCCHTPEGKLAQLLGASRTWAEQWALGARSVRLPFQDGAYVHLENEENASIVRVHARNLNGELERSIVHY